MKAADKPNGPAMAAILAAGIGVAVIGLMTTLNEVFAWLNARLVWVRPVGPLSGKTGVGVIVWIIAWLILASMYRGKQVDVDRISRWAWILIAIGLIGTFPLFFELFAH